MTTKNKTLKIKIAPTFKGQKITDKNVKAYLIDKYQVNKTDNYNTYTFMDGGKFHIDNNKDIKKLYRFLATFDTLPPITERLSKKNLKFKFFIDVDEKGKNNDEVEYYTENEIKEYINDINELFIELGIRPKYILMKNDKKNKYHIIYDFIVNHHIAFRIADYIESKTTLKIDQSVYRSGLRILKARKNKENDSKYYIMESSYTIKKKNELVECSIFNLYNKKEIDIETIPITEKENVVEEKEYPENVEITEEEGEIMSALKKEYTELKGVSLEKNSYGGFDMDYDHNHLCPVSLKKHDKIKCFIKQFKDGGVRLYCYSSRCRGKNIVLKNGNNTINDEFFTDAKLGGLFVEHFGENFIYQNKVLYYWNDDIWEGGEVAENRLNIILSNEFYILVQEIISDNVAIEDKAKWTKISLRLLSRKLKPYIIKEIYTLITNNNIVFDNNEKMDYCLNFKNGLLDLKKIKGNNYARAFRKRIKDDYVSQILDYDFTPEIDEARKNKIDNIFSQQLPEEKEKEFIYRWFSYCLTGDTTEQKYLCSIGYSASNGKSTQSKIFSGCLPIYSLKFDNRTFSENYAKSHKQFIHLGNRPVRFTYIEEIEQSRMNNNLLKDYVDGDEINTEILYGTSKGIKIKSKLNVCSNKDINIYNADEGDLRRGIQLNFKIKFIQKNKYDKLGEKERRNYAVGNKHLINELTSDPLNKNAFIHILLERIEDVIKNGLKEDLFIKNNFKETMEEYDGFKTFINDNYKITEDDEDIVPIEDLLENYRETNNKMSRNVLIKEIKRIGLTFDSRKSKNKKRGCVRGLVELGDCDFD
jgi:hypothetical protein